MNPGQQMFHDFFIERVKEDQKEAAEAILKESFQKQDEGTFDMPYMTQLMPKMTAMLRPECVEEFNQAAAHMSAQVG